MRLPGVCLSSVLLLLGAVKCAQTTHAPEVLDILSTINDEGRLAAVLKSSRGDEFVTAVEFSRDERLDDVLRDIASKITPSRIDAILEENHPTVVRFHIELVMAKHYNAWESLDLSLMAPDRLGRFPIEFIFTRELERMHLLTLVRCVIARLTRGLVNMDVLMSDLPRGFWKHQEARTHESLWCHFVSFNPPGFEERKTASGDANNLQVSDLFYDRVFSWRLDFLLALERWQSPIARRDNQPDSQLFEQRLAKMRHYYYMLQILLHEMVDGGWVIPQLICILKRHALKLKEAALSMSLVTSEKNMIGSFLEHMSVCFSASVIKHMHCDKLKSCPHREQLKWFFDAPENRPYIIGNSFVTRRWFEIATDGPIVLANCSSTAKALFPVIIRMLEGKTPMAEEFSDFAAALVDAAKYGSDLLRALHVSSSEMRKLQRIIKQSPEKFAPLIVCRVNEVDWMRELELDVKTQGALARGLNRPEDRNKRFGILYRAAFVAESNNVIRTVLPQIDTNTLSVGLSPEQESDLEQWILDRISIGFLAEQIEKQVSVTSRRSRDVFWISTGETSCASVNDCDPSLYPPGLQPCRKVSPKRIYEDEDDFTVPEGTCIFGVMAFKTKRRYSHNYDRDSGCRLLQKAESCLQLRFLPHEALKPLWPLDVKDAEKKAIHTQFVYIERMLAALGKALHSPASQLKFEMESLSVRGDGLTVDALGTFGRLIALKRFRVLQRVACGFVPVPFLNSHMMGFLGVWTALCMRHNVGLPWSFSPSFLGFLYGSSDANLDAIIQDAYGELFRGIARCFDGQDSLTLSTLPLVLREHCMFDLPMPLLTPASPFVVDNFLLLERDSVATRTAERHQMQRMECKQYIAHVRHKLREVLLAGRREFQRGFKTFFDDRAAPLLQLEFLKEFVTAGPISRAALCSSFVYHDNTRHLTVRDGSGSVSFRMLVPMLIGRMSNEQLEAFLWFTTGSSQEPTGGFASAPIQICAADSHGLSTATTCMRILNLCLHATADDTYNALIRTLSVASGFSDQELFRDGI